MTAICIINYTSKNYTIRLLKNLNLLTGKFEVFLLENGSPSGKILKTHIPKTKYKVNYFYNKTNIGFAGGMNLLIKKAIKNTKFKYFWLLNNDCKVYKNTLTELVNTQKVQKNVGIVGSLILQSKKSIWWAGSILNLKKGQIKKLNYGQNPSTLNLQIKEVDEINGASMFILKPVVKKIGYFDEHFFHTAEDTDYSMRAKVAGFKLVFNPKSVVLHSVGKSSGSAYSPLHMYYIERGRVLLMKKYNYLNALSLLYLLPLITKRSLAPIVRAKNVKASFYTILGFIDGLKGVYGKKSFK